MDSVTLFIFELNQLLHMNNQKLELESLSSFSEIKSQYLTVVSGIHKQFLQHWLTKALDVTIKQANVLGSIWKQSPNKFVIWDHNWSSGIKSLVFWMR